MSCCDPKTICDAETIEHCRLQLLEEKKSLMARVQTNIIPVVDGFEEEDKPEILSYHDATAPLRVKRLREVQASLERIKKGTFGICVGCGGQISSERLKAAPAAPDCTVCHIKNRSHNTGK